VTSGSPVRRRWCATRSALLALLTAGLVSGCESAERTPRGAPSAGPQLRIVNAGTTPVMQLTVLFPRDEIAFGDVAPGAMTEYRSVPRGVYRYAAYRFMRDGEPMVQPVIDWVGEEAMDGQDFTYTIALTADRSGRPVIVLTSVNRDR
jgi:hypothetical protein